MKRKKTGKRITGLAVLLVCGLVLVGCGRVSREHIDTAMQHIADHEYELALEELEQAAGKEDERLLYRAQGIAYMGLTRYEDAVDCFELALSCSSGLPWDMDYDMNYYLATAYYKLGDTSSAVRIYDTIIDLKPKEKDAYYLRGSVKLKEGDYEAAKQDFDAAIALAPTDFDQLLDIYQVLAEQGYEEVGQGYLQTAIDTDAKEMSDYNKGRIYFYLGNYEDARDYLERARDNSGADAVLYLGRTWEILGDYNYAASVYLSQVTEHPNAEIYNQLGMCRLKMNDPEGALEAFQNGQLVEDCTILQTLQFNEIVAYERLGQFKQAASLMKDYLKAYPDDEQAQRENQFLKTR